MTFTGARWLALAAIAGVAGCDSALMITDGDSAISPPDLAHDIGVSDGRAPGDAAMTSDAAIADAAAVTRVGTVPVDSAPCGLAPPDLGTPECVDGNGCTLATGPGICVGGVYQPCNSNAACTTSFGGGTTPYVCVAGACLRGDCVAHADCGAGRICGVNEPHLCGTCSSDAHCQAAYGAGSVCATVGANAGQCVSAACTSGDDTSCAQNAGDVCCNAACVSGTCCPGAAGDDVCRTRLGTSSARCVAGSCTTCDPPTGGMYVVDPTAGSDALATGSGTSAGVATTSCAFRTITRALAAIGALPPPGTTLVVRGPATVQSGEAWPIVVPPNVTITGSGAVTLAPNPGSSAFTLAAGPSTLRNLMIDGSSHTALSGVVALPGSSDATALDHVTISGFLDDGILVAGGTLAIQAGVSSTSSGTGAAGAAGLHVTGHGGLAIVDVPSGDTVSFSDNTGPGIFVDGTAAVRIHGTPGSMAYTGTVIASNDSYGLLVAQTPSCTRAQSTVVGFVAFANRSAGIQVAPGSSLKLRGSVTLNNAAGVLVDAFPGSMCVFATDVAAIDLGTASDLGLNQMQARFGSGLEPNIGSGLCVDVNSGGQTLQAVGNIFGGLDCATTSGFLSNFHGTCSNYTDIGFGGGAQAGTPVDVSLCSYN